MFPELCGRWNAFRCADEYDRVGALGFRQPILLFDPGWGG